MPAPRIALRHYWFFDLRGGEQVVKNLAGALSIQDVYALCGRRDRVAALVPGARVHFSWLNSLPGIENYYRNLLPLFPFACAAENPAPADIVISNESGPAKAQTVPPGALHICNCFTPMRYLWSHAEEYLATCGGVKKIVFKTLLPVLRAWDRKSADRVHHFVAISDHVKQRVKRFYGSDATVIYPPVRYDMFSVAETKEDYYFALSALVDYKRIDLAIKAFRDIDRPLLVAGSGPELEKYRRMAPKNVKFLGYVADSEIPKLYSKARAFVFPGEEDYGITPLEAQASGTPVIAFRKGGAMETVQEGRTGLFFNTQSVESLVSAVRSYEKEGVALGKNEIREAVRPFNEEKYQSTFRKYVCDRWEEFCATHRSTV